MYAENLKDPGGKLTVRRGTRKAPAVFRGDLDCYALLGFGRAERRFPPGLNYTESPVFVVTDEQGTKYVFVRTDVSRMLDGVPRTYCIPTFPSLCEEVFTDGRAALFALDIDFAPGEMGRAFDEYAG